MGDRLCISAEVRQQFETEQFLPFPRETVFAFFANPANLPKLMPRWQRARIDEVTLCPPPSRPDSRSGVFAGTGSRLKITARALPMLPLRGPWYALIEDFRWNEGFCDVQVKGPFAYWRHCHSVHDAERDGQQGTTVRDAVEYALPLQPLSDAGLPAAHAAMRLLFRYRQARAAELLPRFAQARG